MHLTIHPKPKKNEIKLIFQIFHPLVENIFNQSLGPYISSHMYRESQNIHPSPPKIVALAEHC